MDDYMDWKEGKENSYVLCDGCGDFVKFGKMFTKTYKQSAIMLCHSCTQKLQQQINEYMNDF